MCEYAHAMGNSLGGGGALRFSLQHPDKVAAQILLAPGGAQMSLEEITKLKEQFKQGYHGEITRMMPKIYDETIKLL